MRRLITTLAILVVVLVAGMTALVLLVNPNDFRGYMAQQVEQRSGYKLTIDGDLRWHVWPQLSILSGRMTLTAPGASQPVVSADNMRLDVQLMPLLSHQLSVKQVMLKGAVIRLTPDSNRQRPVNAPVAPAGEVAESGGSAGWSFDIASLRISDSLVIWQPPGSAEYNLRGFNLALTQNSRRDVQIELSSQLNRNQQSLQFSLNGNMDVSQYPQRLSGTLSSAEYQISGADLPREGISGKASFTGDWQQAQQHFNVKNLTLSANESQIDGAVSGNLQPYPTLDAHLHASELNLDTLLGIAPQSGESQTAQSTRSGRAPVIAEPVERSNLDEQLNATDGTLQMVIDQLQWRGMMFNHVQLQAANQRGLLQVAQFSGKNGEGSFSLPATLDARSGQTQVSVTPDIRNLDIAALLKGLNLPAAISGKLNVQGQLQGIGLGLDDAQQHWQGQAALSMTDAQFSRLNFASMIQQAAQRSDARVQSSDATPNATLKQLSAAATLQNGLLSLSNLQGSSEMMTLQGQGQVNLLQRTSDMRFGVTVTGGWQGNNELIQRLQTTAIPLRIYGSWDNPDYSLQIDDALRGQLKDEARKRLEEWMNNQKNSSKASDVKTLLNQAKPAAAH